MLNPMIASRPAERPKLGKVMVGRAPVTVQCSKCKVRALATLVSYHASGVSEAALVAFAYLGRVDAPTYKDRRRVARHAVDHGRWVLCVNRAEAEAYEQGEAERPMAAEPTRVAR